VYAVLVHVVVIAVLVVSYRWSSQADVAPGKIIQAVAVDKLPVQKVKDQKKRKQADEKKRRQQQQQARLKKKQEAEQQRRLKETKRKKQAEAKRKRLAEQRRKKEEEQRQKFAEQSLKEQVAAEEKRRQEEARAARALAEADKYKALIRQKVSRSWNRPPGTAKGLQNIVRVRLVPGGEVLEATVVRSSGVPLFDRSVENAVYKASPLPLPPDPELFDYFRDIEFLFNPEE